MLSACWVVLLYWRALSGPFLYDDIVGIERNPALVSWHSVWTYFRSAVPFSTEYRGFAGSSYRPLAWLTFMVDRHLWGLNAAGFHVTNLVLHWLDGLLGFLLLQKLRIPPLTAAAVCIVWLALPINSEAVAWISGRHISLAAGFILLSLLSAVTFPQRRTAWLLLAYALACLAALLSHEAGVISLPLAVLVAYCYDRHATRALLQLSAVGAAADIFYLALRFAVAASLPINSIAVLPSGLSVFKYLTWIVLPLRMSMERSSDTPADVLSPSTVLALAAIAVLALGVFRFRNRMPWVAAGFAWTLIALLPFSGIVFIYQGMAERWTYIASGGIALAAVALVADANARFRPIAAVLLICWMAWGVWRLEKRVADWDNPLDLYKSSLEATPNSAVLLYNLGITSADAGDTEAAISYYQRALAAKPTYVPALLNLGNLLRRNGYQTLAVGLYQRAINLEPKSPDAWVDLGDAYLEIGATAQARDAYQKALSVDPNNAGAITNLGVVFQRMGDLEAAKSQYQRAISSDPNNGMAHCDLGALLLQSGDVSGAKQALTKGIRLNPSYPAAYFDLGVVYEKSSETGIAMQMYRKALVLKSDYERAHSRLQALERK